MGIFAKLRERVGIIKFLVNAQKTIWYPILFAILCIISGLNDYTVYIPIMWTLVGFVVFSVLFADDNKVFLTPLCMIFFALGSDAPATAFGDSGGDILASMHPDALGQIIAMGIIAVGSFVLRLILDGSLFTAIKRRRHFTVGILAMDVAFLLNGILSPDYDPANFAFGALLAVVLTAVYFLVCGMLENSSNPITYGCVAALCTSYVALIQISVIIYRLILAGRYIYFFPGGGIWLNRSSLTLGWGVSTVIGAVLALGIPAAMYLARNNKASFISFFSCPLLLLGTVVINARSSMLVGACTFIICAIICSINGRNKWPIRIYSCISLVIVVGLVAYVADKNPDWVQTLKNLLRININSDSGRINLWKDGWADFLKFPWFGAGFHEGAYIEEAASKNIYSNMYHNVIIQWLGATGIVGCLAFVIHLFEVLTLPFKRFSINKLVLVTLPLIITTMSVFDNFFFYPHFQIFYAIFLALVEILHNNSTNNLKGAM